MQEKNLTSVLFCCTGNICRSPSAEGVFRKRLERAGLQDRFLIDSAGTHGYHVGEAPDPRTIEAARQRGYDLTCLRARRFERQDFERFHLVLAMDSQNHAYLARLVKPSQGHKLRMMMEFSRRFRGMDVPDPYYGGPGGFDHVLDMLEDAADGLLETLTAGSK
jgi:protein-tyrosine phosphatase